MIVGGQISPSPHSIKNVVVLLSVTEGDSNSHYGISTASLD
jgi:hypothetical protein